MRARQSPALLESRGALGATPLHMAAAEGRADVLAVTPPPLGSLPSTQARLGLRATRDSDCARRASATQIARDARSTAARTRAPMRECVRCAHTLRAVTGAALAALAAATARARARARK